jgi:MYXO-CTERM domain-containing protein
LASTGDGRVLEDNTEAIETELAAYNKLVAPDAPTTKPDAGGAAPAPTTPLLTDSGSTPVPSSAPTAQGPGTGGDAGPSGEGPKAVDDGKNDSGGCSVSSHASSPGAWGWLALGSLAALRRRRQLGRSAG